MCVCEYIHIHTYMYIYVHTQLYHSFFVYSAHNKHRLFSYLGHGNKCCCEHEGADVFLSQCSHLKDFELIFWMVKDKSLISSFCMGISIFSQQHFFEETSLSLLCIFDTHQAKKASSHKENDQQNEKTTYRMGKYLQPIYLMGHSTSKYIFNSYNFTENNK